MKTIDLSCIVGSDVLCEFWSNSYDSHHYGYLFKIEPNGFWMMMNEASISSISDCRILQDHWIYNDGSLVLPDGLMVEVVLDNGEHDRGIMERNKVVLKYGALSGNFVLMDHVRAVKVIGLAEGYTY